MISLLFPQQALNLNVMSHSAGTGVEAGGVQELCQGPVGQEELHGQRQPHQQQRHQVLTLAAHHLLWQNVRDASSCNFSGPLKYLELIILHVLFVIVSPHTFAMNKGSVSKWYFRYMFNDVLAPVGSIPFKSRALLLCLPWVWSHGNPQTGAVLPCLYTVCTGPHTRLEERPRKC